MNQTLNLISIPVEIWQNNIFPHIKSTDFLNLMVSNKIVYNHLQRTEQANKYHHAPLWDIFYGKIIKEIEFFMHTTFSKIRKKIQFPFLDEYQQIITICEVYRHNQEYLSDQNKIIERKLKKKLLGYMRSTQFINNYDTMTGCCYDEAFLLFGTLTRDFYNGKRQLDRHIKKLVHGMKLKDMDEPKTFLAKFDNSMTLDFGGYDQQLQNILPKVIIDRKEKKLLDDHSKFYHQEANISCTNLYSLDALIYYNTELKLLQSNIQILTIFEKILSKLFNNLDYKKIYPISKSNVVRFRLHQAAFVFSVNESKESNNKMNILVYCDSHELRLRNYDTLSAEEKQEFEGEYEDLFKGNFMRDMVASFEYSMQTQGNRLMQIECVYNRFYKEQNLKDCLNTLTKLRNVISKDMLIKAPLFDFWHEFVPSSSFVFDNITLYLDEKTQRGFIVFQVVNGGLQFSIDMNLSFYMQFPAVYFPEDGNKIIKSDLLDHYPEVKTLLKKYFYLILNINYKHSF